MSEQFPSGTNRTNYFFCAAQAGLKQAEARAAPLAAIAHGHFGLMTCYQLQHVQQAIELLSMLSVKGVLWFKMLIGTFAALQL